jgi:hypothetical protein
LYIIIFIEVQNGPIGDLFAAEPSFQQPALPPVRRTRRQASMVSNSLTIRILKYIIFSYFNLKNSNE